MILDIAPLNCAQYRSALQPWKWQLTGIGYSTAAQASGAHCPRNGLWTRSRNDSKDKPRYVCRPQFSSSHTGRPRVVT